jgi:hypothetical protein
MDTGDMRNLKAKIGGMKMEVNTDNLTAAEINALKHLIDEFKKKTNARKLKPQIGEIYWIIDENGTVRTMPWGNFEIENDTWDCGNAYKTEKEAIDELEKRKVETELKRYAKMYNDPDKERWDEENTHYELCYNVVSKHIECYSVLITRRNQVYFTSEGIAKNALKEIGEDRIKRYLLAK